jgi:hypothetical protein
MIIYLTQFYSKIQKIDNPRRAFSRGNGCNFIVYRLGD